MLRPDNDNLPMMAFGSALAVLTIILTCAWIFVNYLGPWIVAWAPASYIVCLIAALLAVVLIS